MKRLGSTFLLVMAAFAPAAAADAPRPVASSATGGVSYTGTNGSSTGTNGGASYGEPVVSPPTAAPKPKPKPKRKPASLAARPQLEAFSVSPSVLTPGQAPTVAFRIKGRAPTIRLRLVISWPGTTNQQRVLDLGRVPANAAQTLSLTPLADPTLPEGQLNVRITGRDSAGRILRPGAHLSRTTQIQVRGHVFPLVGAFSYGTPDDSFGAQRNGHTHQGQDLLAPDGTPVVAPRAGTVTYVGYQASGAGYYLVLDGDGEDLNYVFMHLQKDSITVNTGEHVDQGQRIGSVGHTGDAQGSHLHFEIWQGPWFNGGAAIDPLPYLQQWQQWSPVTAT